ncbi:hypothetical protein QN360_06725 [Glaciimonas sp. CA11.2]|uniref:hypothetical protein n=1 Tax=Glaciimonas sp. CA11.2 TaxID=3048601 RepID=UPI002B223D69|nr:hypothetical protein [Glaciimonas sp. CA11.2]MEB0162599.1 hypothetical protein [Glaciimonas sp. CA11.2]
MAKKIGAPRTTPAGVTLGGVYDECYCSFPLLHRSDEGLHEFLDRIVDSLIPSKDLFSEIRLTGGRAAFFIGWYSIGNTADVFSYALLNKLGGLQIDLEMDVYGSTRTITESD